jgi:dTDP-4-dehydrorhamnose 3,5-epimerase
MKFIPTKIRDVIIIEPQVISDTRGYFMETYRKDLFRENGVDAEFVQDNSSRSVRATLRGLHYQLAPFGQAKLVRVVHGVVFDVAVDLRKNSATFAQWVGVELSEENKLALFIPPGFAHGFYVISENAEFAYKCSTFYNREAERGVLWNDPKINIRWPLVNNQILLSAKDSALPLLKNAEINF